MKKERTYTLIGAYDEDFCLIYKLETELFVFVMVPWAEDNDNPEQFIKVSTNWISQLTVSDLEISFFETSPLDKQARAIIAEHEDYIEECIKAIKEYHKRDVRMIRAMANYRKAWEKDQIASDTE